MTIPDPPAKKQKFGEHDQFGGGERSGPPGGKPFGGYRQDSSSYYPPYVSSSFVYLLLLGRMLKLTAFVVCELFFIFGAFRSLDLYLRVLLKQLNFVGCPQLSLI